MTESDAERILTRMSEPTRSAEKDVCGRSLSGQTCAVPRGTIHNLHNNAAETFWWITGRDSYEIAQVTLPDGTVVRLRDIYDEDGPNA